MPRRFVLSFWNNPPTVEARRGTRIPCEIRLTLVALDSPHTLAEGCLVVLVNPQGCGLRFGHPLKVGARVRLEGLPGDRSVTAQVVNCTSLGQYEKFWLIGIALDRPGNIWGIRNPPDDWGHGAENNSAS